MINFFVKFIMKLFTPCFRKYLLVFFRDTKGLKGILIRYILVKSLAKNCGDNVSIHPNVYLLEVSNMEIGDNVSIHPMCYIDGKGGIAIGSNVSIAHGVTIMSTNHKYDDLDTPIKYQGLSLNKVTIDSNVWVGSKATILNGINVRNGCVIGANSILTKNTIVNGVYVGNPAKLLRERVYK